ncbi:MAG: hypothetical protein GXO65_01980 [Euryarchaeota archaeon]|nr:hypothetical protein [Euryarchaeota archaeon]
MRLLIQKCALIALFLTVLCYPVNAYSIQIWNDGYGPNIRPEINSIYGVHVIQENGDLSSDVWMFFIVPKNFTDKRDDLTISFHPWEHIQNENGPIKINEILICDKPYGDGGWSYDRGYHEPCDEPYNYSISKRERADNLKNYFNYDITFSPKKSDQKLQQFVFKVNYTTPHFIFKQGDYSVAWLDYPNMQNKNFPIINSLLLPTQYDIPRFIPEADRIEMVSYYEGDDRFYRWAFVFRGGDDKIVWYSNDKELKENEREQQLFYTVLGAVIGLFIATIPPYIKRFFDWLRQNIK